MFDKLISDIDWIQQFVNNQSTRGPGLVLLQCQMGIFLRSHRNAQLTQRVEITSFDVISVSAYEFVI